MRKAFTLIELIVVIGIIGILAGILLTSFSGGTEAARAAKCLNNMRSLAVGAINCASSGDMDGYMPSAGTWAELYVGNGEKKCVEHRGWISWLSMNGEYGGRNRKAPESFVQVANASAYCEDDEQAIFAITNGVLWQSVGRSKEVYVCPEHQIVANKKGVKLRWSYVMNAYFGYDWSDGSRVVCATVAGLSRPDKKASDPSIRPDRRLLFAELPIYGTGTPIDEGGTQSGATYPGGGSTETDCVLQYRGFEFNRKWTASAESIAFNHRRSRKGWCAHVVFADGHTEKLAKATSEAISKEQLTALLCAGKDIGFDGSSYTWINQNDRTE